MDFLKKKMKELLDDDDKEKDKDKDKKYVDVHRYASRVFFTWRAAYRCTLYQIVSKV